MSQRFNLTAQLQLQAPTNVNQVVGQIRRQLQGVAVNVQVQGNTRNLAAINRQMQNVRSNANGAAQGVGNLNKNLAEAARRFSVITVATGTMLAFARSIKDGVGEAIQFERELVKISQVTGKSVSQLQGLTKEVTRLSTSLGASSADLLNVSRTLAQAGFSAEKTKQALDILAKTSLAATFDSIQDTTEGAIAVLRQFRKEARQSGGDIKFLEQTLDAINSVSKNFAVESGDLITVIRRVGGVFEAAGGNVNELIALFTSVRATTRESAETISTGLRTIFTRIQRTDTVDQLKALGIELRNSQGQFVGAFEAVRRLSAGLSSLDPKDYRFSEIVESLGGFRQIGKVIPLIRQFTTAQDALNVAQSASGSVARDAATAQLSLYQQAQRVGQEFKALMRTFADSSTFRSIATGALELARAFIRIAEALEPLLPMLGLLAGLRIGRGVAPLLGGLLSGGVRGGGMRGGISRFASGGYVPGSGNRDTVPAMLTPGEFVIKKSSARKLGPETLTAMNNNRYAPGGIITSKPLTKKQLEDARAKGAAGKFFAGSVDAYSVGASEKIGAAKNAIIRAMGDNDGDAELDIAGAFLRPVGIRRKLRGLLSGKEIFNRAYAGAGLAGPRNMKGAKEALGNADLSKLDIPINIFSGTIPFAKRRGFRGKLRKEIGEFTRAWVNQLGPGISYNDVRFRAGYRKANPENLEGNVFEAALVAASNVPFNEIRDTANATFDFPKGLSPELSTLFGIPQGTLTDAKRTFNPDALASLLKKASAILIQRAKGTIGLNAILNQGVNRREAGLAALGLGSGATKPEIQKAIAAQPANQRARFNEVKFNAGGQVDNVPALLTPGEFVINKKSAQSIGYSNLKSMNRTGVAKFEAGGIVTSGRHLYGDLDPPGFGSNIRGARVSFAGVSDIGSKVNRLSKGLNDMGLNISRFPQILNAFRAALQRGLTNEEALNVALKGAGVAVAASARSTTQTTTSNNQLRAAIQQETQELRSSRPGGAGFIGPPLPPGGVQRGGGGGRGGARQFIGMVGQQLDPIAGAAQSFVFAGAMAASLATQFSGLSEVTKQTITEFSGWIATVVGLGGTLAQVLTSMAISGTAEAAASQAAAAGDITEAEASMAAAAAGTGRAILALSAAALIVGGTFKYFSVQAKAQADALKKAYDDVINKIEQGGTGAGAGELMRASLRSGATSQAFSTASTTGAVVAGGTLAAILTTVAIAAGTWGAALAPATLGLSALVAVVVGGAAALGAYFLSTKKNTAAVDEQIASIIESTESLVSLKTAAYNFDQELKDIDLAKLDPEDRIRRRLDAQSTLAPSATAEALKIKELTIGTGKAVATADDFTEGSPERAAFEQASAALAAETENLAKRVAESYKTLDEAFQLDVVQSGDFSFKELMDQQGQYSQSVQAVRSAIQAQTDAIVLNIEMQILAAQKVANSATASAEEQKLANTIIESSTKALADAQERGRQRQKDLTKSQTEAIDAIQKRKESDLAAAQAADDLRRSLDRLNRFGTALAAEEAKLERFGRSLDNVSAIMDNRAMDFSRPIPELENLSEVGNVGAFTNRLNNVIESLPQALQAEGREAVKVVTGAVGVATTGRSRVLDQFGANRPDDKPFNLQDVADVAGVDLTTLTRGQRRAMDEAFEEAYFDQRIDDEEFDKIFDPIINSDAVQKASDLLGRANDFRNKELKEREKQLAQERELSNRRIEAQQNIIRTEVQTAEMLAEARGQEVSLAQKDAARTRAAQAGLSGTNLRAGDIRGAVNLIRENNARQLVIKSLLDNRDALDLSKEKVDELQKEQEELASKTKKAQTELARLADQSEKVADIQSKIAEQRDIRESISDVFEDFAFGGLKERRDILAGVGGIRAAIATGTVQNQSQAQRALTRQMLDALADVPIGPQGQTGEQIKKFLAANDMMRMGLISRQQRDAILVATSTEEKLIIALNMLTMEINAARQGQAASLLPPFIQPFVPFLNKGGYLRGPSHARGGVPIEAEGGEYVIRKSVVRQRGKAFFDRLNSGSLPKFPHGGPVTEQAYLNTSLIAQRTKARADAGDKNAARSHYENFKKWAEEHDVGIYRAKRNTADEKRKQEEEAAMAIKAPSNEEIKIINRTAQADADRQKRLEDERAQSRRDFAASDEGKKFFEEQQTRQYEKSLEFDRFKNRGAPDLGPRTAPKPQRGVFREKRPDFIPAPPKEKTPEPAYDPKTGGVKIKTAGQIPLSTPSVARSGFKLSEQEKSQRERAQRINEIRTREKAEREKKRKDRIAAGGPKGLTRSKSDRLDPLGRRVLGESGATVDDATGRANLSRDFEREEFEKSRQAAKDRIAAKEKARKDAAATRAVNRAAESPEDKARRQKSNRFIRQSERQARIELGTAKGPAIEARKRVEARGGMTGGTPASRARQRVEERRGDITGRTPAERAKQRQQQRRDAAAAPAGTTTTTQQGGFPPHTQNVPTFNAFAQQQQPLQPGQRPPGGGKRAVRGPRPRSVQTPGGVRSSRFVQRQKYGIGGGSRQGAAVRARKYGLQVPQRLQFPQGHGFRQGMGMLPFGGGQQRPFSAMGNIPTSQRAPSFSMGGRKPTSSALGGGGRSEYENLMNIPFEQLTDEQKNILARDSGGGGGQVPFDQAAPSQGRLNQLAGPSAPHIAGPPSGGRLNRGGFVPLDNYTPKGTTPQRNPSMRGPLADMLAPETPRTFHEMRNPNLGGGQFNIQPAPVSGMGTPPPGIRYQDPGAATAATSAAGGAPGAQTMDKLSGIITQLETNFQNIVEKFSTLEHTHTFNGEIGIQVNIGNKEEIVNAVRNMVEGIVKDEVTDIDSTGNAGGGGGNGGN